MVSLSIVFVAAATVLTQMSSIEIASQISCICRNKNGSSSSGNKQMMRCENPNNSNPYEAHPFHLHTLPRHGQSQPNSRYHVWSMVTIYKWIPENKRSIHSKIEMFPSLPTPCVRVSFIALNKLIWFDSIFWTRERRTNVHRKQIEDDRLPNEMRYILSIGQ